MQKAAPTGAASVGSGDLDNCQNATAAAPRPTHPTRLEVFELRCQARAMLVRYGALDFLDAVDILQEGAVFSGLVQEIGQDAVQRILALEFLNV